MKFYIVHSKLSDRQTLRMLSLKQARIEGEQELGPDRFYINLVERPVNVETIRFC